jgi:transcriptional regulator with XRE-family HTH domain
VRRAKFSRKIKILLMDLGITQKELAERAGIPRPYVNLIVNGRLMPSDTQRVAIAGALGKDPQELFGKEAA